MCCLQSIGKSEDEAKVLGLEVARHKDAVEVHEGQLSNAETHIAAVQSSSFVHDVNMARAMVSG